MTPKAAFRIGFALLCVPLVGYAVTMALYAPLQHMAVEGGGSTLLRLGVSWVWNLAYWVMLLLGGIFLAPVGVALVAFGVWKGMRRQRSDT